MKRKTIKRQHILQLVITLFIIILINYISSFIHYRFDLTSEKRYTLSGTTKEILGQLDDIVFIRIYLEGNLPAGFVRLKNAIRELLDEFRIHASNKIEYEFINPTRDTDPNVRRRILAQLYDMGLQPTNIQVRDQEGGTTQKIIIPGAILSYQDIDIAINLLSNNPVLPGEENLNNSIQTLEYEFINMIRNLSSKGIDKIAFIEGHGELDQYQVGDITRELANFYQVDRGTIGGMYGSLDEYKAIIIAKPTLTFNEQDKFVIDQYIMNGGKVLWLIDVVKISLDSLINGSTIALYDPLNLEDQLFRYGVRLNPNLVKDIQCHVIPVNRGLMGGQTNWQFVPWYYYPVVAPVNEHPITRNLNMIIIEFANVIDTVGENKEVQKSVLLTTSPYSTTVNVPVKVSLSETDQRPDEGKYVKSFQPLGVLMEGKFESVFRNRPLPDVISDRPIQFRPFSDHTKMIVISDGDIIKNDVVVSPNGPIIGQLGYDKYTSQLFGNKEFILNSINYLTDQEGLMELRGREFKLKLLDRKKTHEEALKWKLINLVLPVLVIILFGVLFTIARREIYS